MSQEIHITTPMSEDTVRGLHVRDIVHLDGTIFGIRDATQKRIFDDGVNPPVRFSDYPCLHTAPNARKVGNRWEKICIGTTTSTRMEKYSPPLIREYGCRAIIGKGGLLDDSLAAMQEYGAVYLAITGGAAALETTQIEEIEDVFWEDLFPECLWQFRVRDFGPLVVAMDCHGNSLYADVRTHARKQLDALTA
ncbi:MAG: fumarate hydrolyase [Planctomycetes bacterium]|nr:fumarate hydrolyase [Planctomycetota bacterium]